MRQLSLDLFETKRPPTWDDVAKGRARVVKRIGPCDGQSCMFFHGTCTHTADNYAFPKLQADGTCLHTYLEFT